MAKTLWNGTLELDEIAIPVGLVATVSDRSERFRRIHKDCGCRVTMRGYCERHEQLLDPDEILDAWEVAPGEYLPLDPDARSALGPAETRRVPISAFVPAGAIPAELVRKRYRLVPSAAAGAHAYFLFVAAIAELDVAALIRFTAWRSEQLAAIHSRAGALELHSLHFAEDLVESDDTLDRLVDDTGPIDDRLLELARDLVDRHTRPLQPGDLDSLERPRVRALLEQLLAGEPILRAATVQQDERPATGRDLEQALRRSLKTAPRRRRRRAAATATR